ncbi:hypothetical protein QTP70_014867, partial [Hemibagrus guttatus]
MRLEEHMESCSNADT